MFLLKIETNMWSESNSIGLSHTYWRDVSSKCVY